jgi:hypothetical protein
MILSCSSLLQPSLPSPVRRKTIYIGDYFHILITSRKIGVCANLIVENAEESMKIPMNIHNMGLYITKFGLEVDVCQK